MKKVFWVLLMGVVVLAIGGCAETWNKADSRGGLFFSDTADYIVIVRSGGKICDVYKLEDVIVQSDTQSDGWIYKDEEGNSVLASGDVMSIRLNSRNNSYLWETIHEYHDYEEILTYQEKHLQ